MPTTAAPTERDLRLELVDLERVIEANYDADDPTSLHPSVVDSCMSNAYDLGLRPSLDYWVEVIGQVRAEMDAAGL